MPTRPSRRRRPGRHFPMQKREKIAPSRSSARELAGDRRERRVRLAQTPRRSSSSGGFAPARGARRRRQMLGRVAQRPSAARARETCLPCPRARRPAPASPAAAARRPPRSSPTGRLGARRAASPRRSRRLRSSTRGAGPARSILLCTTSRGSAAGSCARIAASASAMPPPARRRPAPARDRRAHRRPGALDAQRLDRVVGRAQSRGVDDRERDAADLDRAASRRGSSRRSA